MGTAVPLRLSGIDSLISYGPRRVPEPGDIGFVVKDRGIVTDQREAESVLHTQERRDLRGMDPASRSRVLANLERE